MVSRVQVNSEFCSSKKCITIRENEGNFESTVLTYLEHIIFFFFSNSSFFFLFQMRLRGINSNHVNAHNFIPRNRYHQKCCKQNLNRQDSGTLADYCANPNRRNAFRSLVRDEVKHKRNSRDWFHVIL